MTATAERRWTDRRSRRAQFRYPERRTGFDRRSFGRMAWYRDRPLLIAGVLAVVVALNIADLVLPRHILARGGIEANPIMSALFEADPAAAAVFKMAVTVGVAATIWAMRRYRKILQVSLTALAAYGLLITYQLALLTNS
ncbi:MAG: DUF5658 family protein [Acidimicrobiia bacterium]|nr:DUF5658 family protein [Acidimicrobiia bacterium]